MGCVWPVTTCRAHACNALVLHMRRSVPQCKKNARQSLEANFVIAGTDPQLRMNYGQKTWLSEEISSKKVVKDKLIVQTQ
jgi:hypothetical protein